MRKEAKLLILLAAPQGFEPRYADPESAVLPLNEGATSAKRTPRERPELVWSRLEMPQSPTCSS